MTEREIELLTFERQWWRNRGSKDQAIRDRFDLTPTRYYQELRDLTQREDVLAFDPVLVNRLRRASNMRHAANQS